MIMWTELSEIYSKLQDEESRFIFRKRLDYNLSGKTDPLREIVRQYKDEDGQTILTLIQNKEKYSQKDIIIFGAGRWGGFYFDLLKKYQIGRGIAAFCDNHAEGEKKGAKILSVQDAVGRFPDAVYVTASTKDRKKMKEQLLSMGVLEENIFLFLYISHVFGRQYFDETIIHPRKNGVFIDGGSLNLYDSEGYMAYNPDYKKIYAFEPDTGNYGNCLRQRERMGLSEKKLEIVNLGLWSSETELSFLNDKGSSCITEKGSESIRTVALDKFISDREKVSYIKLDIEGAELEALKGAAEMIKRDKPDLAICIYHKNEDIVDIPEYILRLNPGYKFYIRHYSCYTWETVLYAVM